MANITLRSSDLTITEVLDNESGNMVEVVRIKGGVAFDEDFITECKNNGVKKWVKDKEEETV